MCGSLFVLYCYEKPQKVTEITLFEMYCNWLCYAVFLIFREDTNCNGGFSIPVRVTISTAHIWLDKAFCGLFFLPQNRHWGFIGSYSSQAPLFMKSSASVCRLLIITIFLPSPQYLFSVFRRRKSGHLPELP